MNKVSVKIDGIEYQISGEKSESEIVKVAKYIDKELETISKAAPNLSKINAAILMSVNVADKLFDEKSKCKKLEEKLKGIDEKTKSKESQLEVEFDNMLKKLNEAETTIKNLEGRVNDLQKDLDDRDAIIETFEGGNKDEATEKKIKSMELKIKELENKVGVAENMATEFENQAYNIKLKYEQLKNGIE